MRIPEAAVYPAPTDHWAMMVQLPVLAHTPILSRPLVLVSIIRIASLVRVVAPRTKTACPTSPCISGKELLKE